MRLRCLYAFTRMRRIVCSAGLQPCNDAQDRQDLMSEQLKAKVRAKYGEAAARAAAGERSHCCGAASAKASCCDPITSNLYDSGESSEVPALALQASLGCGNPTALAELKR